MRKPTTSLGMFKAKLIPAPHTLPPPPVRIPIQIEQMCFPLHNPHPHLHSLRLQRIPKFPALLPRDQIVSGAMNEVRRRPICVLLHLGQRTDGGDLLVAGLGKVGVAGVGVCVLGGGGEFARKTVEEDGEGLALPVHVQDDAGAGVRGRHPAAKGEVFGWDVVLGDLKSALKKIESSN